MEEKKYLDKCPSCGKQIEFIAEGDLDSGHQPDGTYEPGILTVSYDCPYCKDSDADVIIHDWLSTNTKKTKQYLFFF